MINLMFVINQGWPIQHDLVGGGGGALPALVSSCVGHVCRQGRRDRGGVGGVTPPLKTSCRQMKGFVGKQKIIYHKTLSYIRFTVGQYWLRIKKNGKNSVNFVNFRKFVVCYEKFWYVRKIFGPLKWYTDRNFFGGGGGGGKSKIILSGKFFLSANFTLTPPCLVRLATALYAAHPSTCFTTAKSCLTTVFEL